VAQDVGDMDVSLVRKVGELAGEKQRDDVAVAPLYLQRLNAPLRLAAARK
jgi:hypothetical protein